MALDKLLQLLTDKGNQTQRVKLSRLSSEIKEDFYTSYPKNLKSLSIKAEDIEGELSLILALRLLWRLVPESIFKSIDPDFEQLAETSLKDEFGSWPNDEMVQMLGIIFRRLRSAKTEGRPNTSLDLSRPLHIDMFNRQQTACALCLYKFPQGPDIYIDEGDVTYYKEDYVPVENEVYLENYYRKPVLDHVIPFFLGGDGQENWQILCHSCNAGKGESLSWIYRRGWMPPSRIADARTLSPSMRYACLANSHNQSKPLAPEDGKTLRIFKINDKKLIFLDNLEIKHC